MKNMIACAALAVLFLAVTATTAPAKDITITGNAMCAKCQLKQTAQCQTAIQVEKGKNTLTYYLTANDVSKAFHENVCTQTKKVTATGTVKKVDGKLEFAATKIELVK